MVSDDRAKLAQAWDQGHAAALANVEKVSRMSPTEIKDREETTPEAAAVKGIKARAWDEGNQTAGKAVVAARSKEKVDATIAAMEAHKAEMAAQKAAREGGSEQPMSPATAPAPSAWSQLVARTRGMVSDERAKDIAPMAAANRAMEGQPYSYKPGFDRMTGQKPGETNVGPMAQKMATDPVAATAVNKDPETGLLTLDRDKFTKVIASGVAATQKQLDIQKKQIQSLMARRVGGKR